MYTISDATIRELAQKATELKENSPIGTGFFDILESDNDQVTATVIKSNDRFEVYVDYVYSRTEGEWRSTDSLDKRELITLLTKIREEAKEAVGEVA